MKLTTASILLKVVLVVSALVLGAVAFWFVPMYMAHVIQVRPDLAAWDYWMRGYALLVALPVWAVMVLLWRVFGSIPHNNAFSHGNAQAFQWIAWLADFDLALVGGFFIFLCIAGVTPGFLVISFGGAIYMGIVAAIVFHVLSALVRNAAELKQDQDMTI